MARTAAPARRSFYWSALDADERKLVASLGRNLDVMDELHLLRLRILHLAKSSPPDDLDTTRLMLWMMEVLARLSNVQARVNPASCDLAELNEVVRQRLIKAGWNSVETLAQPEPDPV
jgi:hypothetical protein